MFMFVLLCISADWLNHTVSSSTEKKTEVNCSQCSALVPAFVHTCTYTSKHAHTLTPKFELVDSLFWEKWSDSEKVAYSSLSVQRFMEQSRRNPAAQLKHKESASSGLQVQPTAVPIVLLHTLHVERWKKRGGSVSSLAEGI